MNPKLIKLTHNINLDDSIDQFVKKSVPYDHYQNEWKIKLPVLCTAIKI